MLNDLPKDGSPFDPETAQVGYAYRSLDSGRVMSFIGVGPRKRRGGTVYAFQLLSRDAGLLGSTGENLVFDLQHTNLNLFQQPKSNQEQQTMFNQNPKSAIANSRTIDPNIAAIMRDDATTVEVSFGAVGEMPYTYITSVKLELEDYVVVPGKAGGFTVGKVVGVHDDLQLPPNADITYKWVVAKLDLTNYNANLARNATIEQAVADAYQTNARQSMRAAVMAGMAPDAMQRLQAAISGVPALENNNG